MQKIPILFFHSQYFKDIGLSLKFRSFLLKPVVKINYDVIAQNCGGISREDIEFVI
jgi:hypothetical protein